MENKSIREIVEEIAYDQGMDIKFQVSDLLPLIQALEQREKEMFEELRKEIQRLLIFADNGDNSQEDAKGRRTEEKNISPLDTKLKEADDDKENKDEGVGA